MKFALSTGVTPSSVSSSKKIESKLVRPTNHKFLFSIRDDFLNAPIAKQTMPPEQSDERKQLPLPFVGEEY